MLSCELNIHVAIVVKTVPKYPGEYSQESPFFLNSRQYT